MSDTGLIRDLPAVLEDALDRSMVSGEEVLASLPGAMGEALAVTNRRVVIVREKATQDGVDVHSHPISSVTGADVTFIPTGGMLKVGLKTPGRDETNTVYFPVERSTDFQTAADLITRLASTPLASESKVVAMKAGSSSCPQCGAAVGERSAFCPACGTQVRDVCRLCGGAMDPGAGFCPACGSEARPANTACRACGARINETVMSNCPQCGTAVSPKCVSCGASIIEGWPRCRHCGREIGSMEGVSAGAVRAAARQASAVTAAAPAAASTASSGEDTAAGHNARGAALFDEEKFEEAIEEFRRAVTLEPGNGSYHCNLAVAYDEVDEDEDARREYERALELNPNDTTAMLYLGYMLNEGNDPDRAAQLWRRLVETAPGSPEAEEAAQNLRAQEDL